MRRGAAPALTDTIAMAYLDGASEMRKPVLEAKIAGANWEDLSDAFSELS